MSTTTLPARRSLSSEIFSAELAVGVGIAGMPFSGKSRLAKYLEDYGFRNMGYDLHFFGIGTDELKNLDMYHNRDFKNDCWFKYHEEVNPVLTEGQNVVLEAMFRQSQFRRKLPPKLNGIFVGIQLLTDPEVAKTRAAKNNRGIHVVTNEEAPQKIDEYIQALRKQAIKGILHRGILLPKDRNIPEAYKEMWELHSESKTLLHKPGLDSLLYMTPTMPVWVGYVGQVDDFPIENFVSALKEGISHPLDIREILTSSNDYEVRRETLLMQNKLDHYRYPPSFYR